MPHTPAELRSEPPTAGTFTVGNGISAPSLIYKVEPSYTEKARNAHLQGTVLLYVEVSEEGKVENPRVVRSLGLGLDEKAIEAVRKCKFRPGYKDGQPARVVATIEMNFRLTDNPSPLTDSGSQSIGAQMTKCSFSENGCYRVPVAASARGQMIQLSDTQFAIFDGRSWRLADIH